MKVIRHLQDDMEEMLTGGGNDEKSASRGSEEEMNQHPDPNNIHMITHSPTGVSATSTNDDDNGFIFFDEDNYDGHNNQARHYNAKNYVEQKRVVQQTATFRRSFSDSDAGVKIYQPKKVVTLLDRTHLRRI